MTKMNRRDYLLRMGATAGAIASANKLNIFAQQHHEVAESASAMQDQPRGGKVDTSKIFKQPGLRNFDLLSTESVKLIFSGLMAFTPGAGQCVVGFHNRENTKHRHHLRIKIFRKEGDSCSLMEPEIHVSPQTNLKLEVSMPDVLNVHYFQPPELPDGSRHDNDFRWVPNLEGIDWYNRPLTKRSGAYSPTMVIDNGLFYTLQKTASTFRRQTEDGSHVLDVGSVANYIGTNIYLKAGGSVKLTVGPRAFPLPQVTGVRYEIQFHNHCWHKAKGKDCQGEFKPYHLTNKTERNDFYMNYEALQSPPSPEYLLVIAQRGSPTTPAICRGPRVSDESPCSGAGYAGPGGFPSFP